MFTTCWGLILPSSIALVQQEGRDLAGTAAALQGGSQMLFGAAATPLTGLLGTMSVRPTAAIIAIAFVITLVLTPIGWLRRGAGTAGAASHSVEVRTGGTE